MKCSPNSRRAFRHCVQAAGKQSSPQRDLPLIGGSRYMTIRPTHSHRVTNSLPLWWPKHRRLDGVVGLFNASSLANQLSYDYGMLTTGYVGIVAFTLSILKNSGLRRRFNPRSDVTQIGHRVHDVLRGFTYAQSFRSSVSRGPLVGLARHPYQRV